MSAVPVNPAIAGKFLDLLWGEREGYGELRVMSGGAMQPHFFTWPKARGILLDKLPDWDWDDVFMGVLLRTMLGRGDAEHTEKMTNWLWADIDVKRGATFGSVLGSIQHYPQMIVDSGHGWHLYWRLLNPVPVDVAQGAMSVLADRLGGDKVGDPARIMRLPGTVNNKDDDPLAVRLLRFDPVFTHRFSDFDQPQPEVNEGLAQEYNAEGWELSRSDAPKFPDGERNNGLTRLAGAMVFKGMSEDDILSALLAENEVRCDPPLREREVRAIVRSVGRYR